MKAIETRGLTKKFREKTAVNALNLTVEEGELFALLGVNGAGKTTAIKLLSGLLRPTAGGARIFGMDLETDLPRIKAVTGVSPQETAVAPNLSVRENLELIAGIYGADRKTAKHRTEEIMGEFHLEEIAKARAKTLSGGWQRRLSIAMALISRPKLLFLDEPTLGLDVLARRELWQVIEGLKGKMTVILTTHYLEEAEALADHVGIMNQGRLVISDTPEGLKRAANTASFEEAFVQLAGGAEA